MVDGKALTHEYEVGRVIACNDRVMLFDDMGMGKTVSVLIGLKKASEGLGRAYKAVVCAPPTILYQWAGEAADWAREFNVAVVSGNKETRSQIYEYFKSFDGNIILITSYGVFLKDPFYKEVLPDALVLDEAVLLRNKRSKLFQFVASIIHGIEKVVVMSGNVDMFTDGQFYDLASMLFPGIIKCPKAGIISLLGERYQDGSIDMFVNKSPVIRPSGLYLSDEQNDKLYELDVEWNRYEKLGGNNRANILNKRRSVMNSLRIFDPMGCMSQKESFMLNIVQAVEARHDKVVVYCPDVKFFKVLKKDLAESDVKHVAVSGEMPIEIRERNLRLFHDDPGISCILLSGVGRFGLNLQEASELVCMDFRKGKQDLLQVIGRLNRIGQKNNVVCHVPYYIGTDEERKVKVLR